MTGLVAVPLTAAVLGGRHVPGAGAGGGPAAAAVRAGRVQGTAAVGAQHGRQDRRRHDAGGRPGHRHAARRDGHRQRSVTRRAVRWGGTVSGDDRSRIRSGT